MSSTQPNQNNYPNKTLTLMLWPSRNGTIINSPYPSTSSTASTTTPGLSLSRLHDRQSSSAAGDLVGCQAANNDVASNAVGGLVRSDGLSMDEAGIITQPRILSTPESHASQEIRQVGDLSTNSIATVKGVGLISDISDGFCSGGSYSSTQNIDNISSTDNMSSQSGSSSSSSHTSVVHDNNSRSAISSHYSEVGVGTVSDEFQDGQSVSSCDSGVGTGSVGVVGDVNAAVGTDDNDDSGGGGPVSATEERCRCCCHNSAYNTNDVDAELSSNRLTDFTTSTKAGANNALNAIYDETAEIAACSRGDNDSGLSDGDSNGISVLGGSDDRANRATLTGAPHPELTDEKTTTSRVNEGPPPLTIPCPKSPPLRLLSTPPAQAMTALTIVAPAAEEESQPHRAVSEEPSTNLVAGRSILPHDDFENSLRMSTSFEIVGGTLLNCSNDTTTTDVTRGPVCGRVLEEQQQQQQQRLSPRGWWKRRDQNEAGSADAFGQQLHHPPRQELPPSPRGQPTKACGGGRWGWGPLGWIVDAAIATPLSSCSSFPRLKPANCEMKDCRTTSDWTNQDEVAIGNSNPETEQTSADLKSDKDVWPQPIDPQEPLPRNSHSLSKELQAPNKGVADDSYDVVTTQPPAARFLSHRKAHETIPQTYSGGPISTMTKNSISSNKSAINKWRSHSTPDRGGRRTNVEPGSNPRRFSAKSQCRYPGLTSGGQCSDLGHSTMEAASDTSSAKGLWDLWWIVGREIRESAINVVGSIFDTDDVEDDFDDRFASNDSSRPEDDCKNVKGATESITSCESSNFYDILAASNFHSKSNWGADETETASRQSAPSGSDSPTSPTSRTQVTPSEQSYHSRGRYDGERSTQRDFTPEAYCEHIERSHTGHNDYPLRNLPSAATGTPVHRVHEVVDTEDDRIVRAAQKISRNRFGDTNVPKNRCGVDTDKPPILINSPVAVDNAGVVTVMTAAPADSDQLPSDLQRPASASPRSTLSPQQLPLAPDQISQSISPMAGGSRRSNQTLSGGGHLSDSKLRQSPLRSASARRRRPVAKIDLLTSNESCKDGSSVQGGELKSMNNITNNSEEGPELREGRRLLKSNNGFIGGMRRRSPSSSSPNIGGAGCTGIENTRLIVDW